MAINLTKTYTVKSNAQADIRKAIARGECVVGEFTVSALSGGFRIVPHDTRAEAARWPAGTTPGLARLRANGHAEKIRKEVLADQERASADAAAAIVAESADAMAEALAAARGQEEDVIDSTENLTSVPDVIQPPVVIEARITRRPAGFTPGKPAAKAAPDALSPEARALLAAVVYSPALRDLEPEAKVGKWIAYKTIHESDRPHGLNTRRVPGFMTTLSRRGLVECRAEKAGQYSACVTAAGVAALAEAGR